MDQDVVIAGHCRGLAEAARKHFPWENFQQFLAELLLLLQRPTDLELKCLQCAGVLRRFDRPFQRASLGSHCEFAFEPTDSAF